MKLILLFLRLISFGFCSKSLLPSFIEPCGFSDKECLIRSGQNAVQGLAAGVPEMGIKSLDPLRIGSVSSSRSGLNVDFRDTVVNGLKNSKILTLERTLTRMVLETRSTLSLYGNYTLSGSLLIMPIEGVGKYRIRIRDIVVKVIVDFGEQEVNGERHWTFKKWSQTHHVDTGADFKFQNLFNGNKGLSDVVHQFANSNWRDIFQELAPPIIQKVTANIIGEISKLFAAVPMKDMLIE